MNSLSTNYPQMGGTFFSRADTSHEWRCPMGFIDDLKALLTHVENQSVIERDLKIPQSTVSRIVKDFKEKGTSNATLKSLAPMIDYYGFKLVDPRENRHVSEAEMRDKIANEVMKGLLQSGYGEIAGAVFALITKTEVSSVAVAQGDRREQRAVGD